MQSKFDKNLIKHNVNAKLLDTFFMLALIKTPTLIGVFIIKWKIRYCSITSTSAGGEKVN